MGWKEKNRPDGYDSYWFGHYLSSLRSFSGHKRTNGSCLRGPRTTQERRLYDEDYGRSSRAPSRLPEAWDDILRSDADHRSWKRHRLTQWKPKGLVE